MHIELWEFNFVDENNLKNIFNIVFLKQILNLYVKITQK